MPPVSGHAKPFQIRQVKIYRNGTTKALGSAQAMNITPTFTEGTLRGNGRITSVVSIQDGGEFALTEGGIDLDTYALMMGYTTTSGYNTSIGYYQDLDEVVDHCLPWFRALGKSWLENCSEEMHYKIYKCKITSIEGNFSDGEFYVMSASGICIGDEDNGDKWRSWTRYDRTVTLASS
jgi:hypothetical protein